MSTYIPPPHKSSSHSKTKNTRREGNPRRITPNPDSRSSIRRTGDDDVQMVFFFPRTRRDPRAPHAQCLFQTTRCRADTVASTRNAPRRGHSVYPGKCVENDTQGLEHPLFCPAISDHTSRSPRNTPSKRRPRTLEKRPLTHRTQPDRTKGCPRFFKPPDFTARRMSPAHLDVQPPATRPSPAHPPTPPKRPVENGATRDGLAWRLCVIANPSAHF